MTQQNIQMFVAQNGKMFDNYQLQQITNQLQGIDDDKVMMINSASYKDPTMMLIISLFLGGLGVDRFMLGDTGIGVLKLLTGGCFGILTIIDWFSVQKKAKEKNYEIFQEAINMSGMIGNGFVSENTAPHTQNNSIEQIKKYKQLLDDGIITQDEFDAKKKELL